MLISGYAFSTNEASEFYRRQALMEKFEEIKFGRYVTLTNSSPSYSVHRYSGVVDVANCPIQFTSEDLLVWLDGYPMAPFGGEIDYDPVSGKFSAKVYTD